MDERTFNELADTALDQLDRALEDCGADIDVEAKAGGVIEIEFRDGSKAIVNRHTAAREIWLAARSGGFHFRPDSGRWVGTRNGEDLFAAVSRVIEEQSGSPVSLPVPE